MSKGRKLGGQRMSLATMRITRGALYLLFVEVGFSLVYLLSNEQVQAQFVAWVATSSEHVFQHYRVWTLASAALFELDFVSLLFHGLMLWMFLPTLERWWGTKKFLLFALWTLLAGNLGGVLAGLVFGPVPLAGLDPFIFASIIAFGILYANQPVQFFGVLPLTGKQMMIGISAFVALFVVLGQQWVVGASYVAAMLTAAALVSGKLHPRLLYLRWKQRRARRHLAVLRGGAQRPGRKRDEWIN
ncbi:rhomboid family intramembrane serine protease [Haliangium ochraceum]|uniref:Peptidase S54 rhomboid domain-containing protein n=1 Tax=Haliangium ochraceum (strain DSM 14365 / JCM 11303 / SMP-2) TaxID=502025 RepID=D0LGN4_HALO1|nr:rhomboid family intramembrane serine protease [Haliangium ochraceum]ACY12780.1 hypothetical protein Hoch_0139 [Haliangium ochraceum DSM 14365]